jgi:hypothetical protein
MSTFIGKVYGPLHNSSTVFYEVWASEAGVEIIAENDPNARTMRLDPASARNYAALLVRAGDEVERIRHRQHDERQRK